MRAYDLGMLVVSERLLYLYVVYPKGRGKLRVSSQSLQVKPDKIKDCYPACRFFSELIANEMLFSGLNKPTDSWVTTCPVDCNEDFISSVIEALVNLGYVDGEEIYSKEVNPICFDCDLQKVKEVAELVVQSVIGESDGYLGMFYDIVKENYDNALEQLKERGDVGVQGIVSNYRTCFEDAISVLSACKSLHEDLYKYAVGYCSSFGRRCGYYIKYSRWDLSLLDLTKYVLVGLPRKKGKVQKELEEKKNPLYGYYISREFKFSGLRDGDMDNQVIIYSFSTEKDLQDIVCTIRDNKKGFCKDAMLLVLEKIQKKSQQRSQEGKMDYLIKPDWLAVKMFRFNPTTRELIVSIGLSKKILELKSKIQKSQDEGKL